MGYLTSYGAICKYVLIYNNVFFFVFNRDPDSVIWKVTRLCVRDEIGEEGRRYFVKEETGVLGREDTQ